MQSSLKKYMTDQQLKKLGNQLTTHSNCRKATGVARPGKTRRDKGLKPLR